MEQRWNFREPLEIEVILQYPGLGLVRARTRDVSSGGMFVETRPLALSPNTMVQITFVKRHHSPYSLRALIVHATGNGCGLMFTHSNQEDFPALLRILGATSPYSQHPRYTGPPPA